MLKATGGTSLIITEGTPSSFPPSGEVKRVLFLGRSTAAISTAATLAGAASTGAAPALDASRLLLRPGAVYEERKRNEIINDQVALRGRQGIIIIKMMINI